MEDPVCPLDFRYGRKEIKDVFGETSKLQYLLDVEAALARAHAAVGNISKKNADEISKKATMKYVTVKRVNEIEKETRHDIMAVTKALSEACSGDAGKYVHLGATSYDIVDTANALQFAAATDLIKSQVRELRVTIVGLAKEYKNTIMAGRTHGQFSIPITFGLKMAVYAMEVNRHLERLHECKSRLLVGKMSGAVGSGAAMGKHALKIQELVMTDLKLGTEEAATQIVGRDRYIELLSVLTNIASSMEKFATEIRNLQRSEIGEVSEAFEVKKQVGSSTMPQKRNPILCEQVCGIARVIRSFIIPAYENAIQWHERDLCNSSSERFILPHSLIMTDWIVFQMNNVFKSLQVNPERMRQNLENSKGLPMAEAVMTKLVERGMGRGDAHELVRTCSLRAVRDNKQLLSELLENPKVVKLFKKKELEEVMNPRNYLGVSDKIIDQVVKKLTR
ncbi:MAG: adenylosuccinate lyase [Candidatus Thermoplasmatota archaeon]|nr:adenylosuccinate lyase [Candidatus Thermoplasmatota archaeon]